MGTRTRTTSSAWDKNAEAWSRWVREERDPFRDHLLTPALRGALGDVAGKRVLDAGCGEGCYSRWLARRGALVTAVDYSSEMIARASEAERRSRLGIRYQVGDLTDLQGLGRARFDLVLASMSLMCTPDHRGCIREIARVLTSKGRLVCAVNHPCFAVPDSDNYFDPVLVPLTFFKGQRARTAYCHRPLGHYSDALAEHGFAIARIVEPRPQRRHLEKLRRNEAWYRFPAVIVLECARLGRARR